MTCLWCKRGGCLAALNSPVTPLVRAKVTTDNGTVLAVVVREHVGNRLMYSAHALDRDVGAQGASIEDALSRLAVAAEAQPTAPPPPDYVVRWYADAKVQHDPR